MTVEAETVQSGSRDPTMWFISLVVAATAVVLAWLIRQTQQKQSTNVRKEPPPVPKKQSNKAVAKDKKAGGRTKRVSSAPTPQFTHPELLTSLKGHSGLITSGGFSSDGKHFITAAEVRSGRRFDPGGCGMVEGSYASGYPHALATENSSSSSSSSSSSGLEEVDSSSVSSCTSHLAASNSPSDVEDGMTPSMISKMSRRQRKNKNKKTKVPQVGFPGSHGKVSRTVSQSTRRIFEKLGKTESQLFDLLLPLCVLAEDRVLNGYPYVTNLGVYVFKTNGYITLAGVLNGTELVNAEMNKRSQTDLKKTMDVEDAGCDYSECESLEDLSVDNKDDDSNETSSGVSSDSKDSEGDFDCSYSCLSFGEEYESKIISTPNVNFEPNYIFEERKSKTIPQIEKCKRCKQNFSVMENGMKKCKYHPKKFVLRKDERLHYQCCNRLKGVEGCVAAPMHIFHHLKPGVNGPLEGYLASRGGARNVFGLDCEMVFTTEGFELARLTLVSVSGKVMLDVYVKPKGSIFDYNTRFSGITAGHMDKAISFAEVREKVLSMVTASSILVGHSLEGDLAALKMVHRNVVDTALLFRHSSNCDMDLTQSMPHKQSLKTLAKLHLGRDIQKGGSRGHDSVEDATAALDLVLDYILESQTLSTQARKVAPLPLALQNI